MRTRTLACLCAAVALLNTAAAPVDRSSGKKEFLAEESVRVRKVRRLPRRPSDGRWLKVTPAIVRLAPQRTVVLSDADANRHRGAEPLEAEVRALSDGRRLALHVTWPDTTQDRARLSEPGRFGDAVALEIPLRFGAGLRLPYVGMGDPEMHVLVSMVRASTAEDDTTERLRTSSFVGAGYGSLTRAKLAGNKMDLVYDGEERTWSAVFERRWKTRDHNIKKAVVPFALAVWNGSMSQRGGNKFHSRWKVLHDPSRRSNERYIRELGYGYYEGDVGDASAGQTHATTCIGCHRMPGFEVAPLHMAPDLSTIGLTSTYAYLKDSIVQPSQVIVPPTNLNRKYQPEERGAFGAHPSDPSIQWYTEQNDGSRVSRMPRFEHLGDKEVSDLVAYLKTLGEPEKDEETNP